MKNISEIVINVSGYILSATMTKEVLQIIALIASIIGTIVISLCRIIDWYVKVKSDGKITNEELQEGIKIITEETEKVVDKTEKEK